MTKERQIAFTDVVPAIAMYPPIVMYSVLVAAAYSLILHRVSGGD